MQKWWRKVKQLGIPLCLPAPVPASRSIDFVFAFPYVYRNRFLPCQLGFQSDFSGTYGAAFLGLLPERNIFYDRAPVATHYLDISLQVSGGWLLPGLGSTAS